MKKEEEVAAKKLVDFIRGEHVADDRDYIAPGQPGSGPATPFTHAPTDWHANGLPYNSWCRCAECGLVGCSTFTFDFHAAEPGDALVCERCEIRHAVDRG